MIEPGTFDIDRALNVAQLTLRTLTPFFATLALFAETVITTEVPTAATDGKRLLFNRDYVASLQPAERAGLLLHEVLHAALLHVPRRGARDAVLWNIAADIVVNGTILEAIATTDPKVHTEEGNHKKASAKLALPPGGIQEEQLAHLSVEEVYAKLLTDPQWVDLIRSFSPLTADLIEAGHGGELAEKRRAVLEAHWREARLQAAAIDRLRSQGSTPLGLQREMEALQAAQLDWRSYLWRFMVQTPTDFQDFDRRFIARGYYFEALKGESVRVAVVVDTSGSVNEAEMQLLLSEVQGILNAYPQTECTLYYADAALYGPYPLTGRDPIPSPVGGGGTDFRPFFEWIAQGITIGEEPALAVYLTDGYGRFPEEPPAIPVLWVLTNGGIALNAVPFGEATRLLER